MTVFSRLRFVTLTGFFGLSLISGVAQVAPVKTVGPQQVSALPSGVRPRINGPAGAVITTKDFGNVALGDDGSQEIVSPALNKPLTFTPVTGTDFQVGPVSCDTTCTASVTFSPSFPGLRRGAILMRDSANNVVGEAFVYGTGVGPQLGFDLGTEMEYGPAFIPKPAAVAIGPDGSLYYSDTSTPGVYKVRFLPDEGPQKSLFSLTGLPNASISSIAVDGSNTIFLADTNSSTIISITQIPTPGTDFSTSVQGVVTTSPLRTPRAIAVDGAGDLFILDAGNARIIEIDVQGVETVIKTGLQSASGMNVDGAGNIFYADEGQGGQVVEIPVTDRNSTTQIATSLGPQQTALAVDPGGRVYVSFSGILLITPSKVNEGYGTFASAPYNAQVNSNGDLYTTNTGTHTLSMYSRATSSLTLTAATGASTSGNVTIENTGNAALHFDTFNVNGTNFTIDRTASTCKEDASIDAGETCFITVDFTAPASNVQEILTVTSNSGNVSSPNTVTLYGPQPLSSTAFVYSPNLPAAGQPITLTATVTGATNVNRTGQIVAPTGTVQFMEGTTVLGTATLGTPTDLLATATTTVTFPSAGSHAVFAVYSGAANLGASQSPVSRFTVSGPMLTPTSSKIGTSNSMILAGDSEVLTGQVTASTVTAPLTGTLMFFDQNGPLGSAPIIDNTPGGFATLTLTTLSVGTHTVGVTYSGDTNYTTSTDSGLLVIVSTRPTTTTLALSSTSITQGQTVTATAVVGGANGTTPIGRTVTFSDQNGVLAQTIVTSANGVYSATADLPDLSVGRHTITATYDGDSTYAPSASSSMVVIVGTTGPGTSTTLSVSSATTAYRTPVTLTAQVAMNATSAPVTAGQVIFCETSALSCNVLANLGVAQLNGSGVATLRLAPGTVDTHSYKAIFLGTSVAPASTSATQTVTVTGLYPTVTSITSSGAAGNYTLTGTVVGAGTRAVGPGGMVTFRDTTNTGSPVLGTMALGAVAPSFVETPQTPIAVGTNPYGIATGDFNHDGFADIVTENYSPGTVSVLLGKGDGTFQQAVPYAVGSLPERVLVADLDGDGNLDLVVANTRSSTIGILLGNGDGTFKAQVPYDAASPVGLGVMDINHDGFADVVATDYYAGTISVLLGNGDGTLKAAVTYAAGNMPQTLTEGDLDGDGNIDVVVGNFGSNTVSVFRGNGDGTFHAQTTYPVGQGPQGVQVADLRGLGQLDLVVVNSGDNNVGVLQGDGHGAFGAQVIYATGGKPVGVAISDFNGDGFPDLTVSNTTDKTQSVLLGNGAGTFQPMKVFQVGGHPYGQAIADFNGDGTPDIAVSNFDDSTFSVLFSELLQTGTATPSNVSLAGTPGTHNVIASYPGDTNFAATDSTPIQLMSNGSTAVPSVTTLTVTPAAANVGQSVVFAVQVAAVPQRAVAATGTMTLTAVGSSATVPLGTITLDGTGAGSLTNASLPAGTYQVIAAYGGDAVYAASTSGRQTLTVSLVAQTITFPAIVNRVTTDAPFTLEATASSGLAVSYSVVSGPAAVAGNTVTLTGTAGTVTIQASQAGNTMYAAATPVTRSFTVTPPAVTLTGVSPASTVVGSSATTVTLTGTNFASGDIVSFNTTVLASTVVNATTITAVIPAASLATVGTAQISVRDPATQITSLSVTFTVTSKNVPTLTSLTPAAAVAGASATTITVAGTNFTSKSTVQFNGTVIDSTYFDPKTIFAIIPASALKTAGTAQVTVTDPASAITTAGVTFTISATPAIVFTGPATAPSGQQPALNFTLTNPYPVALSGTLGLTFVPSSATPGADDPAVQFSAGGRTLNFTIPANSTVTPAVQLQTGTVAGIATATLNVFDPNGDNLTPSNVVPIVITIPAAIPVLTNVSLVRSGQTLNVVISGFSNTREVSKAAFHFTAASGASVDTPDVTADVTGLFAQWYGSAASVPFGSTVIYTQAFNLDHDASTIGSVSVTLTNSIGVSTSAAAQ